MSAQKQKKKWYLFVNS